MLFFSDGSWYCFGNININIVLSGIVQNALQSLYSHQIKKRRGKQVSFKFRFEGWKWCLSWWRHFRRQTVPRFAAAMEKLDRQLWFEARSVVR